MRCLECDKEVPLLDNEHLARCCGLTLQEYALRHKLPLDILVPPSQINATDDFVVEPTHYCNLLRLPQ